MKKLAFFLGIAMAIFISAQMTSAVQVIDDTLQVNSLKVGQQGVGGVTYFNGTIVNETTGEGDSNNPVTFGDNVRIDGRVYRGATIGASDTQPFIVDDNMEVVGSLTVGSTDVLAQINACMVQSTYDVAGNGKIDADKLDSGIAATLLGAGTISNTEFGYLNGVSSNIQSQLNSKMTQSTYDVAGNSKIDASKLDSGIAATLLGTGTISNTEFGYLNGVTSAIQTQLGSKMTTTTYDAAANGAIDANKLDSGIAATLIGGGGVSNTIFDYLTYLNLDNTSDLKLTALGYQAANSLAVDGYRNTLVGYQAGSGITSGDDNTALGNNTLGATATSSQNTAIGANALALSTDADGTAVGYNALAANTTGTECTAVGSGALDANTIGERNTALGYNALGVNTQSSDNVAIGHSAMAVNLSTGTQNTVVGNYAMDANTNGTWNVAVGYNALGNGDGGDGNTGIGLWALLSATGVGDYNTALGHKAGDNITTGASNIIIGSNIDAPSATADNQLNIGDIIKGSVDATAPRVDIDAGFTFTPSADQTRADDSTITIDNGIVRVVGDGGAALLDLDPAIENGAADGQIVIIQGTHDTNTVQIADSVNTGLDAAGTVTLGQGDTLQLIWDSGDSLWYEISRSNN